MIRASLIALVWLSACGNANNSLIQDGQIVGDTLPAPLTTAPADASRGEIVFFERDQGHCVLCHQVAGLEASFQGNIGPDLTAVGARLSPAQLRLRIVDYQIILPGALMPSYYRIHDLYQVQESHAGETILTAQQVEDLVAYLSQLDIEASDDD